MKRITLSLFAATAILLSSCVKDRISGEGPVVTQTRSVANYSGIDLRVSADVLFQQDPNYKVEVSAQQNIQDVLKVYELDGKLVIRFDDDVRVRRHDPIQIKVWGPSLDKLRISGSGSISTGGAINTGNMEMDISGSGNITVSDLVTGFLDADISGSGNIKVTAGSATEEKLKISGSGNIDVGGVTATKATTTTSGSGDTRVNASQTLNVTISGSGSVFYKNNPLIQTHISGSGKVIPY